MSFTTYHFFRRHAATNYIRLEHVRCHLSGDFMRQISTQFYRMEYEVYVSFKDNVSQFYATNVVASPTSATFLAAYSCTMSIHQSSSYHPHHDALTSTSSTTRSTTRSTTTTATNWLNSIGMRVAAGCPIRLYFSPMSLISAMVSYIKDTG